MEYLNVTQTIRLVFVVLHKLFQNGHYNKSEIRSINHKGSFGFSITHYTYKAFYPMKNFTVQFIHWKSYILQCSTDKGNKQYSFWINRSLMFFTSTWVNSNLRRSLLLIPSKQFLTQKRLISVGIIPCSNMHIPVHSKYSLFTQNNLISKFVEANLKLN